MKEQLEVVGIVDMDDDENVEPKFSVENGKHVIILGLMDTKCGLSLVTLDALKRI